MKKFYFIIFIIIINCSGNKVSNYHGTKGLEKKYEILKLNKTNKNDLLKIIGPPSTISDFDENKWIYVERLKSNQSLLKLGAQKIVKNNILIVELNNVGILQDKTFLNLDNMNDIKYIKSTTGKNFQNKNFMYSLLGSLREKINAPLRNMKKN